MSSKQIGIFVILLVVFFPAAFIYLAIVKGRNKNTASAATIAPSSSARDYDNKNTFSNDTVWVNKGSKVYHADPCCADQTSGKGADYFPLKKAQKLGCRPCKKCCNLAYYK